MKTQLTFPLVALLFIGLAVPAEAKRKRIESSEEYLSSGTPSSSNSSSSFSGGSSRRKMMLGGGIGFYGPSSGTIGVDEKGKHSLGLSGLIAIAAEGEMVMNEVLSVNANFRYYSASDDYKSTATAATTTTKESLWTLGGQGKLTFFNIDDYSGYLAFGIGLVSASAKVGTAEELAPGIGIGFSQAVGALYRVNPALQLGIESFRILGLGSSYNGWLISDLLLKARFQL